MMSAILADPTRLNSACRPPTAVEIDKGTRGEMDRNFRRGCPWDKLEVNQATLQE
jgi:hypothetical protein